MSLKIELKSLNIAVFTSIVLALLSIFAIGTPIELLAKIIACISVIVVTVMFFYEKHMIFGTLWIFNSLLWIYIVYITITHNFLLF